PHTRKGAGRPRLAKRSEWLGSSADVLEDPADTRAARRGDAGDDELLGGVRPALAVDPQAFLDREAALRGAELPQRSARDPQQRAQSIGRQACRDIGAEVKAQRKILLALAA